MNTLLVFLAVAACCKCIEGGKGRKGGKGRIAFWVQIKRTFGAPSRKMCKGTGPGRSLYLNRILYFQPR